MSASKVLPEEVPILRELQLPIKTHRGFVVDPEVYMTAKTILVNTWYTAKPVAMEELSTQTQVPKVKSMNNEAMYSFIARHA